ncbi:MAG: DUF3106 domain-containing protein [bacterium]|nr:DUF3106 domain-containing protein [bacterium]
MMGKANKCAVIALSLWCLALALPVAAEDSAAPDERTSHPRLEALRERNRMRAERLRDATPDEREARRERLRERLREAAPMERRRTLMREWRMMRELPEEERSKIRAENRAFRKKRDLPEPGAARKLARDLELTPEERRVLRARFRRLPHSERRDLWRQIRHFRSLSPEEREALEQRLNEMKLLTEDERVELRQKADRWAAMSEEERERLREQMRRLHALAPDERAELLERALSEVDTKSP